MVKLAACPLIPMEDYVIAIRGESTDSALVPEHLRKPSCKARVVAVGPGRLLQTGAYAPLGVAVGDMVILARHIKDSDGIDIDGTKYMMVQAGAIVAKLADEE